jgi:hypothetical protein
MTSPPPVVPVQATAFPQLRGRRVIVGVPGVGFRGDLRADDPVVQHGRTHVPVLAESEYYHAEAKGIEVFATLVPIDRVWVESVTHDANVCAATTPLDAPAMRRPVPTLTQTGTLGARIVRSVPDGWVRNIRAVTDVFTNGAGDQLIRTCDEIAWYIWALTGEVPVTDELPAMSLWLE